jgi:hypothetical protein
MTYVDINTLSKDSLNNAFEMGEFSHVYRKMRKAIGRLCVRRACLTIWKKKHEAGTRMEKRESEHYKEFLLYAGGFSPSDPLKLDYAQWNQLHPMEAADGSVGPTSISPANGKGNGMGPGVGGVGGLGKTGTGWQQVYSAVHTTAAEMLVVDQVDDPQDVGKRMDRFEAMLLKFGEQVLHTVVLVRLKVWRSFWEIILGNHFGRSFCSTSTIL